MAKKITKKIPQDGSNRKKVAQPKKKVALGAVEKVKNEILDLAKLLSGEMALEKEREEFKKRKTEAVKKQKNKIRKDIVKKARVLKDEPTDELIDTPVDKKVVQKIDLFKWTAPMRISVQFEMKTFLTIVAIALLFILYLAVLGHYGLMFVIIALLFFIYVAGTTDPIDITHKITTQGIDSLDKLYEWYMLDRFWFTLKNGQNMLIVTTKLRFPGKLILLLDEKDRAPIFMLLQEKLLYQDIRKQGKIDRVSFGDYIPLERI